MRILGQPAWVLHLRPWRESSALVEFLTLDHGRVGAVVRGIRGPRQQPLRAALQPLVPLQVDLQLRGELATLRQAEAVAPAVPLRGDGLLAALYANELVLRLAPRHDPAPTLFERYGRLLPALADGALLSWTLRCFERDLLGELGLGLSWDADAAGEPVLPHLRYRIEPEDGLVPEASRSPASVSGEALLGLASGRCPDDAGLAELRRALRALLLVHLGGRPLRSWDLIGRLRASGAVASQPLEG